MSVMPQPVSLSEWIAARLRAWHRGKLPEDETTCDYRDEPLAPFAGIRDGRRAYCDEDCERFALENRH